MLAMVVFGEIASGKSTVSRFVADVTRCQMLSFGAMIREECGRMSILPTRASCQQVGYELFQRVGAAGIVRALLQHAGANPTDCFVIDGVRHCSVLNEIRMLFSPVFVIAVTARLEDRYERYKIRGESGEVLPIEEFVRISNHPIEAGIAAMFPEADVVIDSGVSQEQMLFAVRIALESREILPR